MFRRFDIDNKNLTNHITVPWFYIIFCHSTHLMQVHMDQALEQAERQQDQLGTEDSTVV